MATHKVHEESEHLKERGRREWFANRDYYYDDQTGTVSVDVYESVEFIPYAPAPVQTSREKGTLTVLKEEQIPAVVLRSIQALNLPAPKKP